ncbi:MAG: hypothetical protein JO249_20620 [Acidobacteria bacterium]|nr:hypothetical protein [Acidobacteriota bacterium]
MKLVSRPALNACAASPRPIDGDVLAGFALEPPRYSGIELALELRSHGARLNEGSGVRDLLGRRPVDGAAARGNDARRR